MEDQKTIECPVCKTICIGLKCPRCGYETRSYPDACGPLIYEYEKQRQEEHRKWFDNLPERDEESDEGAVGKNAKWEIHLILYDTQSLTYPIKIYKLSKGWTSFGKAPIAPPAGHMFDKVVAHYHINNKKDMGKYHFMIQYTRRNHSNYIVLKVTDPDALIQIKGQKIKYETTQKIEEEERFRFNGFEAWITTGASAIKPKTNGKEQ